ncbi:MAG TPA: ATP-binding protein [Caldilineaceae bacterium]|nr:ATP-binding protein [Caldilineaceae bacterium]
MARRSVSKSLHRANSLPGWDALLLILLTVALIRIDSLAEAAVLPTLRQDVLRHPLLGGLLSDVGIAAMGERGPWPGEPIGLLLIALALGFAFVYLLVDLARPARWRSRAKWVLLVCVLATALFLPTLKLVLLRQQSGPASYTHDGGVIQTEATIGFLLQGRNPYVEDYTETPMAEWGFDEYRTALYHYPYLPWTFVFSAPFYLLGQAVGFYDQRLVYLLLLAIALALTPRLVAGAPVQPPHPSPPHSREGSGSTPPPKWGRLGGGEQLLSAEDLPFVLDRFWRGNRTRTHAPGTGSGLGLSIASQLVQAHSGTLAVQSEVGKGTEFVIRLSNGAE